jgi:hypothetical protein
MAGCRLKPSPKAVCLLMLGGCQGPFSVERHDLGPFRIAAMGVEDGVARAAVWSGEGMYHSEPLSLAWTLDGVALGEGFDVQVIGAGALGLTATAADGESRQGEVTVAEAAPAFAFTRSAVDLGDDLSLEARTSASETEVTTTVTLEQAMRLRLSFGTQDASALSTRWMTADGQGSLLEVDAFAADVLAEELAWDDGELVDRTPLNAGVYPQLALVIDGAGSNRWQWIDAGFGLEGSWMRHEGRLLPWDGAGDPPTSGLVALTLGAVDPLLGPAPSGMEAVTDLAQQDVLACAPAGLPFLFSWIAEGRCSLTEVDGARVVVEVW